MCAPLFTLDTLAWGMNLVSFVSMFSLKSYVS